MSTSKSEGMIIVESAWGWVKELCAFPAVKGGCAAGMAFILSAVGHPDSAFLALVHLMVADFGLGFYRAWRGDNLRRDKLIKGAVKIVCTWVAVALMFKVDEAVGKTPILNHLLFGASLHGLLIGYFCVTEFISCSEHLASFGVRFPEGIIRKLREYRTAIDTGEWDGRTERRKKDDSGAEE